MDMKHQSGGLNRRGGGGRGGGGYVVIHFPRFQFPLMIYLLVFLLDDSLVVSDLEITVRLRRDLVPEVLWDHAAVVDLIPTTVRHLHLTVKTRSNSCDLKSSCLFYTCIIISLFLVAFCTLPSLFC